MDIQEMMRCLLAKMDENQAKANANTKTMLANNQERLLAKMDASQKEAEAYREDIKEIKSGQAEMRAIIKAWSSNLKINREETLACQEKTEARLEEDKPASVDMTPEVAHEQEVPLEDVVVMPVGEPRKRLRDRRNLAAQRRQ
jgi:hypothetical protein